jgi:hypothetical protein
MSDLGRVMLNNLVGGASVAFGILGVLAVSNVITSYILPDGQTLQAWIGSKTGLDTVGAV